MGYYLNWLWRELPGHPTWNQIKCSIPSRIWGSIFETQWKGLWSFFFLMMEYFSSMLWKVPPKRYQCSISLDCFWYSKNCLRLFLVIVPSSYYFCVISEASGCFPFEIFKLCNLPLWENKVAVWIILCVTISWKGACCMYLVWYPNEFWTLWMVSVVI